jgi:hypothetical protein
MRDEARAVRSLLNGLPGRDGQVGRKRNRLAACVPHDQHSARVQAAGNQNAGRFDERLSRRPDQQFVAALKPSLEMRGRAPDR